MILVIEMPAGRPTDYNDELADEICIRVAGGRTVLSICDDEDMPDKATFYRWRIKHPEFRDKLMCAREERIDNDADTLRDLATRIMSDSALDPQRVNAAANAIDKAARLTAPKQRVEHTGANGGPIKTEELSQNDLARRIAFALAQAK